MIAIPPAGHNIRIGQFFNNKEEHVSRHYFCSFKILFNIYILCKNINLGIYNMFMGFFYIYLNYMYVYHLFARYNQ